MSAEAAVISRHTSASPSTQHCTVIVLLTAYVDYVVHGLLLLALTHSCELPVVI